MEITPDAKLAAASRIMQGLLASGHYTEITENGEPFVKWSSRDEKDYVVEQTMGLLDSLIEEIQKDEAIWGEVERDKTEDSLLEEPTERPWLTAQTDSTKRDTQ